MKLLKEFNDDRIKIYKNDKNRGLVYSLNRALKYCKGKIYCKNGYR